MKKSFKIASALTLSAILATGVSYAVSGAATMAEEEPVLEIASSYPAEGAVMAALKEGTIVKMTPAASVLTEYPELYCEYEIEEKDANGEWVNFKSVSYMIHHAPTETEPEEYFYSEAMMDYVMYKETEYRFKYYAWEDEATRNYFPKEVVGIGYVYVTGTSERYVPSPYKFSEIWPLDSGNDVYGDTGLLYDDVPYLRITFTGPVNLGNSEETFIKLDTYSKISFEKFEAEGESETIDGVEYAKTWLLYFADGFLKSLDTPILVVVKAKDAEGRVVQGEVGEDADSYSVFYYNVPGMYVEVGIEFDSNYPESLQTITATNFTYGINFSYYVAYNDAKVYLDGKVAASVKAEPVKKYDAGDEANPDAVAHMSVMTLDKKLTQPGIYTLVIPKSYFNIGTEHTTFYQDEIRMKFALGNPTVDFTATPAAGTVAELSTISIEFDVDGNLKMADDTDKPYLYDAQEDSNAAWDRDGVAVDGKTLNLTLANTITTPGYYSLVIPMGFLSVNGKDLPSISVDYTISNSMPVDIEIEFTPASGTLTELPEQIDFVFPQFEEDAWTGGMGKATIQFNDEEPVALSDALFDYDAPLNEGWQPLDDFAGKTDAGTYTIVFPAGYFMVGPSSDPTPEFKVVYTIEGDEPGPQPDPEVKFTPANNAELEALPQSIFFDFGQEYLAYAEYSDTYATIQKDNEAAVELPQLEYDYSWAKGTGYQELGEFAGSTAEGTYTITFPDNYFRLGSWSPDVLTSSTEVKEMKLIYVVKNDLDGVELVGIEASHYTVYDLNGNLVLDTDDAEALKALKGLYIVNGFKMMLK